MSTQTSLGELQTAIYTRLTNDATLAGVITGVFDFANVPLNQAFPYVTIGDATEAPNNTLGRRGYDTTLTLHIWSKYKGFKECQTILARMNYLLDQNVLPLASQTSVSMMYDFSQTMNDPNDQTIRHMPVRYRAFNQE